MKSSLATGSEKKEKSLDSSDYDSDAGASPSLSDTDSSSVSSRASSPGALKIVESNLVTPKKRTGNNDGANTPTANTRMSKRKPIVPSASKTRQLGTSVIDAGVITSTSKSAGSSKPLNNNGSGSAVINSSRKRKRQKNSNKGSTIKLPSQSASKRPCLNQRRRTKSERNTRAGKTVTVPVEEVALDAEIDKFLEEKAIKNNLTATNVKSIIRHVITNNMVQKMVMSAGKKKGTNPDDSSDDEAFYEPKLTRARRKLLGEHDPHNSTPLWPSLSASSPVKSNRAQGVSHVLIHEELPEDSSGDEEYVPREDEIHSDDENSSIASHTSEVGSPCPVASTSKRTSLSSSRTRQGNKEDSSKSVSNITKEGRASPVFKTPTPVRPKCVRKLDSGISKRTRSKLPLNDTPLEDLEMQLIPPDITTDMYDWGLSDNEDYLAFLKEFLCPGQNTGGSNEAGDDDEVADPEYNVMEEEEEHDKEELRMDRAVKVSKKELNELVAELIEESHFSNFTSGEELDDTEFASFCASQLSNTTGSNVQEANAPLPSVCSTNPTGQTLEVPPVSRQEAATSTVKKSIQSASNAEPCYAADPYYISVSKREEKGTQNPERLAGSKPLQTETITSSNKLSPESSSALNGISVSPVSPVLLPSGRISITNNTIVPASFVDGTPATAAKAVNESISHPVPSSNSNTNLVSEPQFSTDAIAILKHQIRQHTQLLAQSYVLTVTVDDPNLKNISFHSKRMINEMRSLLMLNGPLSVLSGGNLECAWNLVNSWPPKSSKSPIKKKILEEKYMNDCQQVPKDKEISSSTECCTFPRPVAKVIAESPAFPYSELLPVRFDQKSSIFLHFTLSEDMLIVCGYDDLKEYKLNTRAKAEAIARTLLPARATTRVFHRIKNLRRNSNISRHSTIREYFQLGKALPGAEVPKHWDQSLLRPPISQPVEVLPNAWRILILRLAQHSEFSWRGVDEKRRRARNKNLVNNSDTIPDLSQPAVSADSSPVKRKNKKDSDIISSVFPVGSTMSQMLKCEDVESFPIRDTNGNPGVWISIPKWLPEKSDSLSSDPGIDKAPQECYVLQYDSPPKLSCDQDQNDAQSASPDAVHGKDSVSITRVGEPFDLPTDIEIQGSDVIDLASLATPLKRAILENAEGHVVTLDVSNVESGNEMTFCVDNMESGNSYSFEIETSRDQHSARTFGGTREDLNDSKRQGYNDYDDEAEDGTTTESSESAESDSLSDDEDPTDGESSQDQDPASPVQIIAEVTLSSDEETPVSSEKMKVQDPSESGDDNKQPDNQSSAGNDQNTPAKIGSNSCPSESTSKNTSSSCSGHIGGKRGRGEDDDDDGDKKNNRRNPRDYLGKGNPDAAEPDETEEEETESKELSSAQRKSKSKSQKKRKDKKRKNSPSKEKSKKSPSSSNAANSGSGKKRPMKSSKCTPVEKMLEEDSALDEEVSDAFLESFMHRLQAATEKKHPGLNNEFVKLLCEAEQNTGNSDKELLTKIKILLKDYPDLLTEFTTYIESDENYVPVKEDEHFQEKQQNDAYVQFLRHLEKFTERNPQLKAKILHKLKLFSEASDPSQREIAASLEPFFQGNEVMMRAFEAILPSVYRPDSINNQLDFEVVDMESEEFSTQEDHNVESVILPEEKAVPASNTCPCICHDALTATHVYSTRAKHCQKCCLKDGKVFVHNGRVTKQVNVEMTSASDAKKKSSGNTCKSCVQDSNSATMKFKESFVAPTSSKVKEEAEFKRPKAHASHQSLSSIPSSTVTSCGSQEVLEDMKANSCSTKAENRDVEKNTFQSDRKAWSLEEDHLILTAVKSAEADLDEVFEKLTSELPNRDRTEVESRCVELISLLQSEFGSVADELANE